MSLKSKQQDGYAGRHFTIMTENGEHVLKGPWSSRSGVMNSEHPLAIANPCTEIGLTDKEKTFEKGFTYYSSATTVELLNTILTKVFNFELNQTVIRGDIRFKLDKSLCNIPNHKKWKITDKPHIWKERLDVQK